MMKKRVFVSIALTIIIVGPAWAHHNMSALFDFNQRFTRTGTFTELDWRNPHIYLSVDVKSEEDQVETWFFEGPAASIFRAWDIGKSDFESSLSKTITVEARRARDGSLSGLIRMITLSDGTVVSLCPQNC